MVRFIEKIKKYEARFGCVDPSTGNFERKSFYGSTKTEALRRGRKWVSDVRDGSTQIGNERMKLSEWIDCWLKDYAKSSVREKTYEKYESCLKYAKDHIGDKYLRQLKPQDIQEFLNQLLIDGSRHKKPLSPTTVINTRRYVIQCLNQAVVMGIINKNPATATKPAKRQVRQMFVFSKGQINHIIELLDKDLAAAEDIRNIYWLHTLKSIIILATGTGMRVGELLGLAWYDVVLHELEGAIHVTRTLVKTNHKTFFSAPKTRTSRRKILISEREVDALKEYQAWQNEHKKQLGSLYNDQDLVFHSLLGMPLDHSKLTIYYQEILKKSGIQHARFHDLRHTHASWLFAQNVHPKVVQERLVHASIAITLDTYSHFLPDMQDIALKAMRNMFNN